MLPDLRSSAQSRMVSAGTRNRNSHGWNVKNGCEIGLAALVEVAEVERERAREDEEDHDEHVRDRSREVARELALHDR